MMFDQFATLTQGAIHGMGAALIPTFLIQRELAEGRLIPIFGAPVRALGSYYLVWPESRPDRAPLRSLRLWLHSEASDPALTALSREDAHQSPANIRKRTKLRLRHGL